MIGLREHKDSAERTQALELSLAGKDLSIRPQYWQDLSEANLKVMKARAKPVQALMDRSAADRALVEDWLRQHAQQAERVRYLPFVSRDLFWTVLLDGESMAVIGHLPVDGY